MIASELLGQKLESDEALPTAILDFADHSRLPPPNFRVMPSREMVRPIVEAGSTIGGAYYSL